MDISKELKDNIKNLIEKNMIEEAGELLDEYKLLNHNDVEMYSIEGVFNILKGDIEKAYKILSSGIIRYPEDFDINYNLAYLFEQKNDYNKSMLYYHNAKMSTNDEKIISEIEGIIKTMNESMGESVNIRKKKLVFFSKGDDKFIEGIMVGLASEYETKKITITRNEELNLVDKWMEWCDICWFEWCDELIIYASKLQKAEEKIMICRIHSYEAFTDYPYQVNWKNVDKLIFVAGDIRENVLSKIELDKSKTVIIPNGIDLNKFVFKNRKHGFNIAYVGYINYKKGPMLLLHAFKAIHDSDNRYKLYIAGNFQDERYVLYFNQMIEEMGIQNSVFFEGWQDDLDKWMEDKNYILCTSLLESQNISVMQAMAKGIKPIIHNFVGARNIYEDVWIWNTVEDLKVTIKSSFNSAEYRCFIEKYYSLDSMIADIRLNIDTLLNCRIEKKEEKLVTVGITNYNGIKYIEQCVESYIKQAYKNIEIIIIDDNSQDGSKEIIKEYVRKYSFIRAIYHEENSGGPAKGLAELIIEAKGEYIHWIACDDYVESSTICYMVQSIEENESVDYVFSDLTIVNEESIIQGKWEYEEIDNRKAIKHIYETGSGVIPMNGLYRKTFFTKNNITWIKYGSNDYCSDTQNFLQFCRYGFRHKKCNKSNIYYRIHSNNISHNLEQRVHTSYYLYKYIFNYLDERIYEPNIDWNEVKERERIKNIIMIKFYIKKIDKYINGELIPGYIINKRSKIVILDSCRIFLNEIKDILHEDPIIEKIKDEYIENMIIKYKKYVDILDMDRQ